VVGVTDADEEQTTGGCGVHGSGHLGVRRRWYGDCTRGVVDKKD
jgi:hypothetical protein